MKAIGILLLVLAGLGLIMGFNMVGDIGIACIVGSVAALLSGIGFLLVAKNLKSK